MSTLSTYRSAITATYPELPITSVQLHTTDGQFNVIVFVNDDLVFRFPRSHHVAEAYADQADLLRFLADKLPLPIPVPVYESAPDTPWDQRFLGYQRIVGEPLYSEALAAIQTEADLDAMAEQLATFLRTLHRLPITDLPLHLPMSDTSAAWDDLYQGIRTELFPHMRPDAQQWASAHFAVGRALLQTEDVQPVLRHGDFGGSNILYDPRTKRVSGILDFESAGLGDPATDVAALSCYGEAFFAHCLRYYPEMNTLLARAAFYRGTFALQEAYYGLRDGNQEAFANGIVPYR